MKTTNYAKTINGKPVVNGTRRVKLHITPMDTKNRNKKDEFGCVAAKALLRQVPNCVAARVHLGRVYLLNKNDDTWRRYKTSDSLRTEVVAFDRGGTFEPGDYDLVPLAPSDRKENRRKYVQRDPDRGTPGNIPQKTPRKLHVTQGVRQGKSTIYR